MDKIRFLGMFYFLCVPFSFLFSSLPALAIDHQDIIFNEIAWAGSSVSGPSDEWIELYNRTDNDIDLSGYKITRYDKNSGNEVLILVFPTNSIIHTNGFFLLTDGNSNSAIEVSADISLLLKIDDSQLQLKLYDDLGILIDTAGDRGLALRGKNNGGIKSSMSRIPDNIGTGEIKDNWFTSQKSLNLSNTTNLGSPGNTASTFTDAFPEVVYEDGEDGDIVGWDIYDNTPSTANISSINGTIVINGEVMQKYYFSEYNSSSEANEYNGTAVKFSGLRNNSHLNASFSFKSIDSKFTIYIRVMTKNNGLRYLEYTPGDVNWLGIDYSSKHSWIDNDEYIHYYLGNSSNDGQWHTATRDLQSDLSDGNAGEEILYIEGLYVRMTGEIDNFILLAE